MLPRFTAKDFAAVGYCMGLLVYMLGALMFLPAIVALIYQETEALIHFLFGAAFCFAIGSLLLLLKRSKLNKRRLFLLAGGGWIIVAILAASPLYSIGSFSNYFDAMFDAMSAITTTGVSIASDLDHMAVSQITWRSILSLAGAQAIIMVALYLGFFGEGTYSRRIQGQARRNTNDLNLARTSTLVVLVPLCVTGVATLAIFFILMTAETDPLQALADAFCLACNAASTSSFIPHAANLVYFHNAFLNSFIAIIIMLTSVNFIVYLRIFRREFKGQGAAIETKAFLVWLIVLVISITVVLTRDEIFAGASTMINRGAFMVVSAATTCGMQTVYPDQMTISFNEGAVAILFLAVVVGASGCSPGGGIKIVRIGHITAWLVYTVKNALLPFKMRTSIKGFSSDISSEDFSRDAVQSMIISIFYVAFVALGAVMFIAHGYPVFNSLLESASFACNCGMTSGISLSTTELDLKIVTFLQMWAGRIEFIAFFSFFCGLFISIFPGKRRSKKHTFFANRKAALTSAASLKVQNTLNANGKTIQKSKTRTFMPRTSTSCNTIMACFSVMLIAVIAMFAPLASTQANAAADNIRSQAELGDTESSEQVQTSSPSAQQTEITHYREMSISELLNATQRMDKTQVQISGEAIGRAIQADDEHKWVNILQDGKEIGVYMAADEADKIQVWGTYGKRGDTVTVQGTFNLSCENHSGELEMRADNVQISPGGDIQNDTSDIVFVLIATLALFSIGLIFAIVRYIKEGRLPRVQKIF